MEFNKALSTTSKSRQKLDDMLNNPSFVVEEVYKSIHRLSKEEME